MQGQVLAVALISISTLLILSMIIRVQERNKNRLRVGMEHELRAKMIFLAQDETIAKIINEPPFKVNSGYDDSINRCNIDPNMRGPHNAR